MRTFKDVETDPPKLVGVRMIAVCHHYSQAESARESTDVQLGDEADLRRRHRVLFRQEQLELEDAACTSRSR